MRKSYFQASENLSFPNAPIGNPDETRTEPPIKMLGGEDFGITSHRCFLISRRATGQWSPCCGGIANAEVKAGMKLNHSTGNNFFPVPSSSREIALVGQILAARRIFSSLSPLGSMTSAIIFASSLNTFGVAWIHLA